jgi:hypothetical protein
LLEVVGWWLVKYCPFTPWTRGEEARLIEAVGRLVGEHDVVSFDWLYARELAQPGRAGWPAGRPRRPVAGGLEIGVVGVGSTMIRHNRHPGSEGLRDRTVVDALTVSLRRLHRRAPVQCAQAQKGTRPS